MKKDLSTSSSPPDAPANNELALRKEAFVLLGEYYARSASATMGLSLKSREKMAALACCIAASALDKDGIMHVLGTMPFHATISDKADAIIRYLTNSNNAEGDRHG